MMIGPVGVVGVVGVVGAPLPGLGATGPKGTPLSKVRPGAWSTKRTGLHSVSPRFIAMNPRRYVPAVLTWYVATCQPVAP